MFRFIFDKADKSMMKTMGIAKLDIKTMALSILRMRAEKNSVEGML
jgi:hypothetical protein